MKKKIASYLFVFCLLFFSSCNKDDGTLIQLDFALVVNPSFTTADVNWAVTSGEDNTGLLFDIFLNDTLVLSNVVELPITLEDLATATTYHLKVVAKYDAGESAKEIEFLTLDPLDFDVKLSKITDFNGGLSDSLSYAYNDSGLLKTIAWADGLATSYTFDYDESGQLTHQIIAEFLSFHRITVAYEESNIRAARIEYFSDFDFYRSEIYVDVINPEAYLAYEREIDWGTGDIISEIIYEITVQLDSENRVTNYNNIRQDTSDEVAIEFEYTGANLTKVIINGDTASAWEIIYDDKVNYNRDVRSYKMSQSYGNLGVSSYVRRQLAFIPQMLYYNSPNNIVETRSGGMVVNRYEFEYNVFNLPSRITYPENTNAYNELFYTIEE